MLHKVFIVELRGTRDFDVQIIVDGHCERPYFRTLSRTQWHELSLRWQWYSGLQIPAERFDNVPEELAGVCNGEIAHPK